MSLCAVGGRPATYSGTVVVSVDSAINPGASPRSVIDKNSMPSPIKAGVTPSPGAKRDPQANAEAKADGTPYVKSGARGDENDCWVVSGHNYKSGVGGLNLDIRAAADDDAIVAAQVTIVPGFFAHALHGVHNILTLGEECIAQIAGPVYVGSHGVEDRGER